MIGRKKEINYLSKGLSNLGRLRCAFVRGPKGIGKTTLINKLTSGFIADGNHIILQANASFCSNPKDLLSNFIRNLSASKSLQWDQNLRLFARKLGHLIHQDVSIGSKQKKPYSLSNNFVQELADNLSSRGCSKNDIIPLVLIEDIENFSSGLLSWLSGEFNHALRNSRWFSNCRFIFSSTQRVQEFEKFWADFGIENPVEFDLPPFNLRELSQLALINDYENINGEELRDLSDGIPGIALKYLQKGKIMNTEKEMQEDVVQKTPNLDSYSEKELEYLLYLSYPSKINRHNLEHFCTSKLAAFAYNWVKRQKNLFTSLPNGDLLLDDSIKKCMRDFHVEQEPAKAEIMTTLASVLDAFYDLFPSIDSQWIPINLQAFNSFSKGLCKKVFDEVESEQVVEFIEANIDIFEKNGKQLCLANDIVLVIRRYMELTGLQEKESLRQDIINAWEEDQLAMKERKSKIDNEELNLKNEIEEINSQVSHFQSLKKDIENNSKGPNSNKPKKVVSFSLSIALVIFGLGVVGACLFSEHLGAYHAACGLALTLLGFFWPNVEMKAPDGRGTINSPNLAIETQQRSLEHRINGLLNRANSLALSLESLSNEAVELEQNSLEPYINAT